jgi:hypothetical protein
MTSEVGDLTTQTQSTLTLALHSRARATLLAEADLRNNARLLSLTLPQAHSWLLAVPYEPTLQLSPNEFRQAARYRLGVSDHNHQGNLRCRQCDKVQNPRDQGLSYGDHSMPWRRLHSPPPQPPQNFSLSYSQGGRLQSPDGNCAFHTRQPHPSWRHLRAGW